MGNKFSSGKHAIAECDRCGFQFKLTALKSEYEYNKPTGLLVCRDCWTAEHPQNDLGKYPVEDPQAVKNARPDRALDTSRVYQWGWNPVGFIDNGMTPNALKGQGSVGTVSVVVS